MMKKLGFSGLKSLDQLKSFNVPSSGTTRSFQSSSRPYADTVSSGTFANLKLIAEKLIKEQASVKMDLEMANAKLKKSEDQVRALEAKLQDSNNENAKLKVKQKEDSKLWKGLDSKVSSTKALCDELTDTLQCLASQVRGAEEDKKFFEDKLSASSKAFEDLHLQMSTLSSKLESAEENIRKGTQESEKLRTEKEQMKKSYMDESCRTDMLIREKDAAIKQLEATVEEDKIDLQSLNCRLQELQKELCLKEDACKILEVTQENLEKDKTDLLFKNTDYEQKLLASGLERKKFKDEVSGFADKLIDLDRLNTTASNNLVQLSSAWETCYKLVQQDKDLTAKYAQLKFDRLHAQFLDITSENGTFQSEIHELKNKVEELQKALHLISGQCEEELHSAEEKIRRSELDMRNLISKKIELEVLVTKLEGEIAHAIEVSNERENQKQDLLLKISRLESQNQDIQDQAQSMLQGKVGEIETLQKEIAKCNLYVDSLENQVNQLRENLDEKERSHLQLKDREKQLEEQKTEIQASLAAAECSLAEARKQYDLVLEGKQLELTKHLKEISLRNDQEINDIRRKYEVEKLEILNSEKERVEKLIEETERRCDKKIVETKEEALRQLMRVQEEHGALINQIQLEHDKKELGRRAQHSQELQRVQLQVENEFTEKITMLRKEQEIHTKALKHQHQEEQKELLEELELQKSKEEKQRALLQLQWKVMGDNQQEDLEVNSKKEYSVSSIKMRETDVGNGGQLALIKQENEGKDTNILGVVCTPMGTLLKKVEKGNAGSLANIPKHSKKVTRHEYEIETSNGKTITKRRKTKSTVMFGGSPHNRKNTKACKTSKNVMEVRKGIKGNRPHPSNIGDLFKEGSLDPYADDPYAFD